MKIFEIPIYYRTREQASEDSYWRAYDYNEIIGWISLHSRDNAIRAEHWLTIQKPSKVLIKKEFDNKGKLFQINVKNLTNIQIYKKINNALNDMQANSLLSRYCLDLETFKTTGRYLKWRHILQK